MQILYAPLIELTWPFPEAVNKNRDMGGGLVRGERSKKAFCHPRNQMGENGEEEKEKENP